MATPVGITLPTDCAIIEIGSLANTPVAGNKFNGGYVRQENWSITPVVGDYIQISGESSVMFNQEGVVYAYVPVSDFLFIQTALP